MFHHWLQIWMGWVETFGYTGVFALMAMESSVLPVPAEIVMPPAAFFAAQGKLSYGGVILAGTAGSLAGSLLSYVLAMALGFPLLKRYGKLVLLPPKKLELAETWVARYGTFGIFTARLLPVVRHLISLPAGALKMPLGRFSVATVLGAGLWCSVLTWFGGEVLGSRPDLLQSPEAMTLLIKEKLHWFILGALLMAVLYALVLKIKGGAARTASAQAS